MHTIFHLAYQQYKHHVKKKGFLLSLFLFLFLAINLIPHHTAEYATFYFGNYTGAPSAAWLGSLGAVLCNTVLLIIGFFFLEGNYQQKIQQGIGRLIRSTAASNSTILWSQWLSNVFTLLTFLALLIATLFLSNLSVFIQDGFHLFTFLKPFALLSLPFIGILAAFVLLIDTSIKSRVLRIILFMVLFLTVHTMTNPTFIPFLDVIGFNELTSIVKQELLAQQLIDNETGYGIGYITNKKDLQYIDWSFTNWTLHLMPKLFTLFCLGLLIQLKAFFFGRYKINNSILPTIKKEIPLSSPKGISTTRQWKGIDSITPSQQWIYLWFQEWKLLQKLFHPIAIITIIALWIAAFYATETIVSYMITPAMMLLALPLYSRFFNSIAQNNLANLFLTSSYHPVLQAGIKISIATFINILLLIPIFKYQIPLEIGITTIAFLLLSITAFISTRYRALKLFEIAYIVLFISYTNGSPLLPLY